MSLSTSLKTSLLSLTRFIQGTTPFKETLEKLKAGEPKLVVEGLFGSAKTLFLAGLFEILERPMLIITPTHEAAQRISQELNTFLVPNFLYPAEETDLRLEVLNHLLSQKKVAVVAGAKAVAEKTLDPETFLKSKITFKKGQEILRDELIERLTQVGYKRMEMVGGKGEFSVRGGIIDVYPIRIELYEDKVESLRIFDPATQRSISLIEKAEILPVAEEPKTQDLFAYLSSDALLILDEPVEISLAADLNFKKNWQVLELTRLSALGERILFEIQLPESFVEILDELERKVKKGQLKVHTEEGVDENLLADFRTGDLVVHENYGIGIYRGLETLLIDDAEQEYFLIEYAEGDKLYVPLYQMGLVGKYSSGSDNIPKLSRLGGTEWPRAKKRAKESIKDLTQELLDLYSERKNIAGFPFSEDSLWQKELEGAFPYEETPDQQVAVLAVKKDMESPQPMERLLCGDVGYGKTEVALRAAFKATVSGKQVAILVPTTVLAEQHYRTISERFQPFPITVEMLSRFQSKKEQKRILKALEVGGLDVVIGTHRLLQKDIKFKDLGLLIIDEEQRFGVAHKEKLKKFFKAVDVLTLTATPIPRTLYMSLSGVRDMSMINTPPLDRSPIRTFVLEWNEGVIKEAVLRELERGGQVFFVHNRIETIELIARKLAKLMPQARIAVAHGQMPEGELEKVMRDFLERKDDILLSTTIIESGLDLPNVNTIIIDHADRFGLAELHQLRGRVGRSAVRAYAYLFYHKGELTKEAIDRLAAIKDFTALGSGYRIAMKDLEIRGAGNVLGAEQHGHLMAIGFDLYCQLLEETARELKGIIPSKKERAFIDLKIDASIPRNYIEDEKQRIATYKRLNRVERLAEAEDLKKELIDRYGSVPEKVENLFELLKLRIQAEAKKIKSIESKEKVVIIQFLSKDTKIIPIAELSKSRWFAIIKEFVEGLPS